MKKNISVVMSWVAFLALAVALCASPARPGGGGPSVSYAEMTITDNSSLYVVSSDSLGSYLDYRLTSNANDFCTTGTVNSTGWTVFYLNRSLSSGAFCNTSANLPSGFTARTWTMVFGDAQACDILLGSTTQPCTLTVQTQYFERIIPGGVFGANGNTTTTAVSFSFTQNGHPYSVQTDHGAVVGFVNSTTRTVTYSGSSATARLWQGSTALTGSFPFPFQLTIEIPPQP